VKEKFKIFKEVFDQYTLKTLYKLSNDGYIKELGGIISTGKEANIFYAIDEENNPVAVKIYRIETSKFKREKYIIGDPRFEKKQKLSSKRGIIDIWAKKEFKNLEKAYKNNIRVPKPIIQRNNVLIMEFIGENERPAPIAKDNPPKEPKIWLEKILNSIMTLYQKSGLVHGDLNEFNILNFKEEPVIIDMAQSVLRDHPLSDDLLLKDIKNILTWFKKLGVETPNANEFFRKVKGNA